MAVTLAASACMWQAPRGDSAGTGSSPWPWEIGVGEVGALVEAWRAPVGGSGGTTPVLSGNTVVAVGSAGIFAFDATGCGQPECPPIWQDSGSFGQPTIAGDLVYVAKGNHLAAYDLRGAETCSGEPRRCDPRWTGSETATHVNAADGIVVTTGGSGGWVYDAGDGSACPGGSCAPTRRLAPPPCNWVLGCRSGPVSIGEGLLAFGTINTEEFAGEGELFAYDLAGVEECEPTPGGPDVCDPLWRAGVGAVTAAPAIVDGQVVFDQARWVLDDEGLSYEVLDHRVTVVGTNASSTWSVTDLSPDRGHVAVAGTTVFDVHGRNVRAFDLGTGTVLWSAETTSFVSGVSEAGGVLYVATPAAVLAFDHAACAAAPGDRCEPVASLAGARAAVSISNGRVWAVGTDGFLRSLQPTP